MIEITIITVVKNNLEGIRKTMKSIRSQVFNNFEHIIIDSNSSDGTSDFIRENLNPQTIHIRENDSGIYEAINKGVKLSKGKFIGLLHSGDIYFSKSTLKYIFQNLNNFDYIFGNIAYFKNKKIKRLWNFSQSEKLSPLKIPHTSLFIKKEIIDDLNYYDKDFKISSDTDFLIKLSKKPYRYQKIEDYIIYMEAGGVSFSSSNFFKKAKEDLIILFRYYRFLFIFYYIYKILIKFCGFNLILNKEEFKILEKNFLNII